MTSQTISKGKDKKVSFFKGVKTEMKKVSWPNKKTLLNHTMVVIVVCALMALFVGLLDTGFRTLIKLIVG